MKRQVFINLYLQFFFQILLTTSEAAGYIILVVSVSASVCMCVCQTITFERTDVGSSLTFTLTHPVYVQGIRVKFVYEGHRVKVKVTGARNVENAYSRNVKL